MLELVEMEVRELLSQYEFPGDDTPIIAGSALKALEAAAENKTDEWTAKIEELMSAVDDYIPTPERDTEKPFLMPIEDVFSISGVELLLQEELKEVSYNLEKKLKLLV